MNSVFFYLLDLEKRVIIFYEEYVSLAFLVKGRFNKNLFLVYV